MLKIFTNENSFGQAAVLLDAHTTSPGGQESAIVRNDQSSDEKRRETEIYDHARRIYQRGRRTSLRRGLGII